MLSLIATLLVLAGIVMILGGALWFILTAFQESVLWGLGVMLIGVISPIFLILHWRRAKDPFFLQLYGVGCVILAVILANNHLPWPLH